MEEAIYKETDLEYFLIKLNKYLDYILIIESGRSTKNQRQEAGKLRIELIEESGKYKNIIADLTGIPTTYLPNINKENIKSDKWLNALANNFTQNNIHVLRYCIDNTRQAIGPLKEDIKNGKRDRIGYIINQQNKANIINSDLLKILGRFTIFANALKERNVRREAITIADEYDVQYLLYALLKLHFDDVRKEEWTPSYAGGSARMDFLIKEEKSIIEVKMTRETLRDKSIGDELLIDVARYKNYPDCNLLLCYVYDPKRLILNPIGLENDLAKLSTEQFRVNVLIRY
jgi:hypothetical protein